MALDPIYSHKYAKAIIHWIQYFIMDYITYSCILRCINLSIISSDGSLTICDVLKHNLFLINGNYTSKIKYNATCICCMRHCLHNPKHSVSWSFPTIINNQPDFRNNFDSVSNPNDLEIISESMPLLLIKQMYMKSLAESKFSSVSRNVVFYFMTVPYFSYWNNFRESCFKVYCELEITLLTLRTWCSSISFINMTLKK